MSNDTRRSCVYLLVIAIAAASPSLTHAQHWAHTGSESDWIRGNSTSSMSPTVNGYTYYVKMETRGASAGGITRACTLPLSLSGTQGLEVEKGITWYGLDDYWWDDDGTNQPEPSFSYKLDAQGSASAGVIGTGGPPARSSSATAGFEVSEGHWLFGFRTIGDVSVDTNGPNAKSTPTAGGVVTVTSDNKSDPISGSIILPTVTRGSWPRKSGLATGGVHVIGANNTTPSALAGGTFTVKSDPDSP